MKKLFASFDYDAAHDLKGSLISQLSDLGLAFDVTDISLKERAPDDEWRARAESAIVAADIFVVILSLNAHQAPGVHEEVLMARRHGKDRFQLKPQQQNSKRFKSAGPVIEWTRLKLAEALSTVRFR
jgi:hypothetical protein